MLLIFRGFVRTKLTKDSKQSRNLHVGGRRPYTAWHAKARIQQKATGVTAGDRLFSDWQQQPVLVANSSATEGSSAPLSRPPLSASFFSLLPVSFRLPTSHQQQPANSREVTSAASAGVAFSCVSSSFLTVPPAGKKTMRSSEATHAATVEGILGRPVFEMLDHPAILRFRTDYQRHRLGYAKGAKGEVEAALRQVEEAPKQQQQPHAHAPLPEGIPEEVKESLLSPFATFSSDSPFARDEQLLTQIAKWRMEYQNFRNGAPRGAAGSLEDIAKGLSLGALKLLPVVQLAEVLRRDRQPARPEVSLPSPHLHFGGGKLGFGLVLEAMTRSGVQDLVIVQRPSSDFSPLTSALVDQEIPVTVNGRPVCTLEVYAKAEDVQRLVEHLQQKQQQPEHTAAGHSTRCHLVLSDDRPLLLSLASLAGSMSCSLGPGIRPALVPLLSELQDKPENEQVLLYACENDHAAVEKMKEEVKSKVHVLACMVDRICANRTIYSDRIEVEAEPYEGEIVVLDRPEDAPPPPFGGPNVHAPKLKAAAHYLCQRKIGLVNGMHTTLAFLTACDKTDMLLKALHEASKPRTANRDVNGGNQRPSEDPLLAALRQVPLLKETEMGREEKRMMWAWLAARCLHVLWEHDKERAHNIQTDEEVVKMLLDYGKKTLARFSTVQDTAGRVLGGGVVNRFHTRLLTIYSFLEQHIFGSVPLASNLLKHANINAFEMIDAVRRLVDQARIFVEK
ncbi:hypothetical protein Efla_000760 [Eimeria flavescens]